MEKYYTPPTTNNHNSNVQKLVQFLPAHLKKLVLRTHPLRSIILVKLQTINDLKNIISNQHSPSLQKNIYKEWRNIRFTYF